MKNFKKFGIIAFAAIMVFLFAACDINDPEKPDDPNNPEMPDIPNVPGAGLGDIPSNDVDKDSASYITESDAIVNIFMPIYETMASKFIYLNDAVEGFIENAMGEGQSSINISLNTIPGLAARGMRNITGTVTGSVSDSGYSGKGNGISFIYESKTDTLEGGGNSRYAGDMAGKMNITSEFSGSWSSTAVSESESVAFSFAGIFNDGDYFGKIIINGGYSFAISYNYTTNKQSITSVPDASFRVQIFGENDVRVYDFTATRDQALDLMGFDFSGDVSSGNQPGLQYPNALDYTIGNLHQIEGSVEAVTITPNNGSSPGDITIYYDGSIEVPQTEGFYAVRFHVAAAEGWNEAWLYAGDLIIHPVGSDIPDLQYPNEWDYTIGNLHQIEGNVEAVTIIPNEGNSPGDITIYYNGSTDIPQEEGVYAITFDVAAAEGWSEAKGFIARIWNEAEGFVAAELIVYPAGSDIGTPGLEFTLQQWDNTYSVSRGTLFSASEIVIPAIYNGSLVTAIESYAFQNNTSLTSITIPSSVTRIEWDAFSGCTSLTNITIPDSVTWISHGAFSGCTSLTSITIPDSVTGIAWGAFSGCTSLTSVTIGSGLTSIEDVVFSGCTSLTSIKIPDSVTSIGNNAFSGCTNLTNVTIPNSVTTIGDGAFSSTGLTSITIPASVTSIGNGAFSGCANLTSILIDNNPNYVIIGGILYDKLVTQIIWVPSNISGSIIIPNSVTSIGEYEFAWCDSLTSITIGNSVMSIGERAFIGCTSLTSITIPNSVTYIGIGAFIDCTSLTSITIPNSVTSIGEGTFWGCSNLTSIIIPNGVTSIGVWAFASCFNLMSITIPASVTSIGNEAFYLWSNSQIINIPFNTIEEAAAVWGSRWMINCNAVIRNKNGEQIWPLS